MHAVVAHHDDVGIVRCPLHQLAEHLDHLVVEADLVPHIFEFSGLVGIALSQQGQRRLKGLDQAEDVMACKIQSCWRHRTARARLYDEVCRMFRKYWSADYQCYYYVHVEYPDEQLWERPWLIDVCFRAFCACDKLPLDRLAEIPRNPTGKILKHELRARYSD